MTRTGVGDRLQRDGFVHHGINLAFGGELHRINLHELSGGRSVTVYAQHEVLKDLIAKRLHDGGDVRFGVMDTTVEGVDSDRCQDAPNDEQSAPVAVFPVGPGVAEWLNTAGALLLGTHSVPFQAH